MSVVLAKIAEARAFAHKLSGNLPDLVSAAALGVRSKAPFQLLCVREALIWRTEELARTACDAVERDDLTVAALLTRATIESAALVWKLMELLDARTKHTAGELNETLMRLLVGSRRWPDFPQAFQILTCVDRLDKAVPGVRASYDTLSEIAHPNWAGVFGLYSKTDEARFTTYFGRGLRDKEETAGMIIQAMLGALPLFEHAYNRIGEMMPVFLSELESIWPAETEPTPDDRAR